MSMHFKAHGMLDCLSKGPITQASMKECSNSLMKSRATNITVANGKKIVRSGQGKDGRC